MPDVTKAKGRDFAKFLESLPEDVRARGNDESVRAAEAEHQRFLECFRNGHCYLCKKPLAFFSKKTPCPHWLLKPKGFKKNDFLVVTHRYGFFQIQSFLRWVANQEGSGLAARYAEPIVLPNGAALTGSMRSTVFIDPPCT